MKKNTNINEKVNRNTGGAGVTPVGGGVVLPGPPGCLILNDRFLFLPFNNTTDPLLSYNISHLFLVGSPLQHHSLGKRSSRRCPIFLTKLPSRDTVLTTPPLGGPVINPPLAP